MNVRYVSNDNTIEDIPSYKTAMLQFSTGKIGQTS